MLLALASAPCIHQVEIKHSQGTETALLLLFLEKCNLNKKCREVKKKKKKEELEQVALVFYVIETCEPRAECEAMFSRDGLALERRS